MYDWYLDLPWWIRGGLAAVVLTGGAAVVYWVSVRVGYVVCGLGFALLLIGGRTDAEKNGYKF